MTTTQTVPLVDRRCTECGEAPQWRCAATGGKHVLAAVAS